MTTLLLRVDAGPAIGVGHLSRCVAVAEEAVARGWTVTVTGTLTGAAWLTTRLTELGVEIRPDLTPADIVLVDHYGHIPLPDTHLVSIEDGPYGRRRADVVVDCNLAPAPRPDDGSPLVLRGPAYAPLRAAIRTARTHRAREPWAVTDSQRAREPRDRPRVVVAMGGGAMAGTVSAALTALWATALPMDVLAISAAPLDPGTPSPGATIEVSPPRPDLPDLFAAADLVISAAGVTLLELCCLAVPTALVVAADNQLPGYTAATDRALAAPLGDLTDTEAATATLRHLLTTPTARAALSRAAAKTVDGHGARRILNAAAGLTTRPATPADSDRLLAWRNDPVTRHWSVNQDLVPQAVHETWLATALTTRHLLIAEESGTPIAVIRFDPTAPGEVEVSITLAPQARGRGLARPVLEAAHDHLTDTRVLARVHRDNTASRRLFASAGYRPTQRPAEDGFDFYAIDL
ncbi:GNAT family N-acetyltransferase [Actinokineospora sp. 24-640]